MHTIPDDVLDRIVGHRPHLASIVTNLRRAQGRNQIQHLERALANAYLLGEIHLTGPETYALSWCCVGRGYGCASDDPLSERVRQALADCGRSHYQVSQATGIDQASLSRFISHERGLHSDTLDRLVSYLHL